MEDDRGNACHAVCTVDFVGWICVLHSFQKKSKRSIKMPKDDMDLSHTRLSATLQDFDAWQAQQATHR